MKSLLGPCTQLQLEPLAYPEFWDRTDNMIANTWTPEEIGIGPDLLTYHRLSQSADLQDKSKLHWFKALWGQLTAFDMLRSEDATLLLSMILQPEEIKHFLIRLAWEERLHTKSYRYVVQQLGLPETGPDSVYEMWQHVPSMRARVEYAENVNSGVSLIFQMHLDHENWQSPTNLQIILRSMIFWFIIFEKVWFMINLAGPLQHMARTKPGGAPQEFEAAAEQLRYIARDEVQHIAGGCDLIKHFYAEHPEVRTEQFMLSIQQMFEDCLRLEEEYVNYCSQIQPLFGYLVTDHIETAKLFANHGVRACGNFLPDPFPGVKHRFPWMAEAMETNQESNFFEKRPKEYQVGRSLGWENESRQTDLNELLQWNQAR